MDTGVKTGRDKHGNGLSHWNLKRRERFRRTSSSCEWLSQRISPSDLRRCSYRNGYWSSRRTQWINAYSLSNFLKVVDFFRKKYWVIVLSMVLWITLRSWRKSMRTWCRPRFCVFLWDFGIVVCIHQNIYSQCLRRGLLFRKSDNACVVGFFLP